MWICYALHMRNASDLPDDTDALKAMLAASLAALADRDAVIERKEDRIVRLEKLLADFKRALFGHRSEKSDPEQYELALEDIETAIAAIHAEDDAVDPAKTRPAKPRNANRGSLPKHLPRIEEVIEPDTQICGCGGNLHQIGDDTSERLDVIPAQFRVIVTRRPKYACRSCSNGVVQAPAPARLIPGGMPTEATVAHVPPLGDASIACRATGLQICRSPATLPTGADLQPSRHRSGSLHSRRLGRQGRL